VGPAGASPAATANRRRNAARAGRRRRWRPARAALWRLLDAHVPAGARVAVLGAGNGDDLPLHALARRAAAVELVDLDPAAAARARRRLPSGRRRVRVVAEDVTLGAADALVARATGAPAAPAPPAARPPLPGAPYDVVIADAVLSQLAYPALRDAGLDGAAIDRALLGGGQALTDAVVARLLASAPGGVLVIVDDVLGWWAGHPQPFALDAVLACAAREGPGAARALVRRGSPAYGCDAEAALRRAGGELLDIAFWRWPFAPGAEYLVCGRVARSRRGDR
jgi:SAM-dependent methyltransferase